ncbi:hypothetical protein BOO69_00300 [Sulfitobacter alexandrii]|uniref:HTH luxR-type domain-containing protein n=1 Tax=Sulfitobacter alexandrii TaxID=1917485 RepID=A0A1J0WCJ2_9RHOB|nr:LuxR C-terminal-related transcriptional regulator [Sulfitobacter alexandrii]APE42021.1 hypothetical protein BOO69_00300 [Sulfitobacter alexandrii]
MPFPNATDTHSRIARCFALLNDWHAAIAGHAPLTDVIAVLTRQTSARNISFYRFREDRSVPIAAARRQDDTAAAENSKGTLARYLRATRDAEIPPGTMLSLSDLRAEAEFPGSAAAAEWDPREDIINVVLIVLADRPGQLDVIEMIFDSIPSLNPDIPPVLVSAALAEAWKMRAPGLITRITLSNIRSRSQSVQVPSSGILSGNNPCGLSRAEQRVCHMLVAGQKAKTIAEELDLSVATVRTHLRNIYSKTQTAGQVELIALVNDPDGVVS